MDWKKWYRYTFTAFGISAFVFSIVDCIFDITKSLSGDLLFIFAFISIIELLIHNKWVLQRSKKEYYTLISVFSFLLFFTLSIFTHIIKGRDINFSKILFGSLTISAIAITGFLLYELYFYLKLKSVNKRLEKYRNE